MHPIPDDQLRLIFTCCHPALAPGGRRRADAAHPRRPHDARDRARVPRPGAHARPAARPREEEDPRGRDRLRGAAAASAWPTGWMPCCACCTSCSTRDTMRSSGEALIRRELCAEAIRLARVVADAAARRARGAGLLALMLLTDARRPAREGPDGELVRLEDQDRSRWDRGADRGGGALVERGAPRRVASGPTSSRRRSRPSTTRRRRPRDTDWPQILGLYGVLRASRRPRSWTSTGRSPWPRSRGRRWVWRWSTRSRRPGAGRVPVPARDPRGLPAPAGPWGAAADAYGRALAPGAQRAGAVVPRSGADGARSRLAAQ